MNARQKRQEKGVKLLEICLNLHMSNTGYSELTKETYEFYIENLNQTYNEWEESVENKSIGFDRAVKDLVMKTIIEDRIAKAERTGIARL